MALTRAKCSLFVLGKASALVKNPIWRGLIEDAKARLCYFPVPPVSWDASLSASSSSNRADRSPGIECRTLEGWTIWSSEHPPPWRSNRRHWPNPRRGSKLPRPSRYSPASTLACSGAPRRRLSGGYQRSSSSVTLSRQQAPPPWPPSLPSHGPATCHRQMLARLVVFYRLTSRIWSRAPHDGHSALMQSASRKCQ